MNDKKIEPGALLAWLDEQIDYDNRATLPEYAENVKMMTAIRPLIANAPSPELVDELDYKQMWTEVRMHVREGHEIDHPLLLHIERRHSGLPACLAAEVKEPFDPMKTIYPPSAQAKQARGSVIAEKYAYDTVLFMGTEKMAFKNSVAEILIRGLRSIGVAVDDAEVK
jgi:hypothetical protein